MREFGKIFSLVTSEGDAPSVYPGRKQRLALGMAIETVLLTRVVGIIDIKAK